MHKLWEKNCIWDKVIKILVSYSQGDCSKLMTNTPLKPFYMPPSSLCINSLCLVDWLQVFRVTNKQWTALNLTKAPKPSPTNSWKTRGIPGHSSPCSSGLSLIKNLGASLQRGSEDEGNVSVCFVLLRLKRQEIQIPHCTRADQCHRDHCWAAREAPRAVLAPTCVYVSVMV